MPLLGDWVRPASAPSTMMICTDISTWSRRKNRSYTNLQSVIRSPTRVSRPSNEVSDVWTQA